MNNITSSAPIEIVQLGNPILQKIAKPVDDISDTSFQELIDTLISTVVQAHGMGLAAPQVGQSQRVFILSSHPNLRYPTAPKMPPTAIINPQILSHGATIIKDWEGCLSIPGIRARVPRWETISVSYQTRDGVTHQTEYTGFIARIFQHELDHLDGKVFFDRVESTADIFTEQEFLKVVAQKP